MRDSMARAMTMFTSDGRYAIRFRCFFGKPVKAAVAAGYDELKLCAALAEVARQNSGE
jgi:hypothetical protein